MTHSSWLNVNIPRCLLRGASFAMVQMNRMAEKTEIGHTWATVRCLHHDRELLAGRCSQDQKKILVLRIKSDSARIVLDSDRMPCWTTHCAEEW